MEDHKHHYREQATAWIEALSSAREAWGEGNAEVVGSVRRIARSLDGSPLAHNFPEVRKAALALGEASEDTIPLRMEKLIELLRAASSVVEDVHTILLVDDDPDFCRMLEARLSGPGREILVAETAAQGEQILEGQGVSLIILDLILPDVDGRNLLVRLRERSRSAGLPVFVVSARAGTQSKTECFALGADGYFEKPVNLETLAAAVAAKLQRTEELARELREDPLTGLPNRAAFKELFDRTQALANRSGRSLSLAILDVDRFKITNDTCGHAVGDNLLRRVARVIPDSLRRSDVLARWGGDEFVVLFPDTGEQGAAQALDKARQNLRKEQFHATDGRTFHVSFTLTFSAGVIEVPKAASVEEAVAEADRFLYYAKALGRNRVVGSRDEVAVPRKKILFAEDDEAIAFLVKQLLAEQGCEVFHCVDGGQALRAVTENGFSLVILDILMPVMDGFEVLERLRKIPSCAAVPVVILTSMGKESDVIRGFDLGADEYIVKPFSPLELLARVRRLLNQRA